jgi:glycosyltransferase involved in cell wall biosynthesis
VRVLVLAQGPPRVASSRTRVFAWLPHLRRAGVDPDVLVWNTERFVARTLTGHAPVGEHARNALHQLRVLAELVRRAGRYDAVYVQKVVLPAWVLRRLKRGGRRLVFDYDDALYVVTPGLDRGLRGLVRRWRVRRFAACLGESDLVTLENEPNREYTARYCRSTLLITGPIDTDRYHPVSRPVRGEVVLGWIGSPSTTQYLALLEPVLAELVRRGRRVTLNLIGAGAYESPHVAVRSIPWDLATEVDALATFDVGLMPLTDDRWARGKGGYKILQYMAMGIPTVASPVGINVEMLRHGKTGFLAADVDDWIRALDTLILDRALRLQLGEAARADALARYSLAHYAPAFVDALTGGDVRRAPPAATPVEAVP